MTDPNDLGNLGNLLKSFQIPDFGEELRRNLEKSTSILRLSELSRIDKFKDALIPNIPDLGSLALFNNPIINMAAGVKEMGYNLGMLPTHNAHFENLMKSATLPSVGLHLHDFIKHIESTVIKPHPYQFRTYQLHEYLDAIISSNDGTETSEVIEHDTEQIHVLIDKVGESILEFSESSAVKIDELNEIILRWFIEAIEVCKSEKTKSIVGAIFLIVLQLYPTIATKTGQFIRNPSMENLVSISDLSEGSKDYVAKFETSLHFKASDSTKTLCRVPSGYPIKVLEKKKVWMKVEFVDEKREESFSGWVRIDHFEEY